MKVTFLTSGHDPFDDRIFYHMAKSLADRNHSVSIITSTVLNNGNVNSIKLNCFNGINLAKRDKVLEFICRIKVEEAEVIICSEPLTVYAAHKYRKIWSPNAKIIYDITEWYPSKKNLSSGNQLNKWLRFIKLTCFNIWVSRFVDSYIFGEWYKSIPYRFLFPGRPFIFTSYYPELGFIKSLSPQIQPNKLRLSYSGKLNKDKGFDNFIRVIDQLSLHKKNMKIDIKIIGWKDMLCEKNNNSLIMPERDNISVTYYNKQPFFDFLNLITDTDIFIDLRLIDFENNLCLPIRLFYFIAMGRPIIFSNLKSIRKEADIKNYGFLVDPSDTKQIVDIICFYLDNTEIYLDHCHEARKAAEEKFNWGLLSNKFAEFVETNRH